MVWQQITIERDKLYEEIWAEPMTKVAPRYGVSDVGLRKICVKLDVPVPPRGYWSKLAAGKIIPKPALHKSTVTPTYTRIVTVTEKDSVLEERLGKAREADNVRDPSEITQYLPPSDPQSFHPQAKLVVKAMRGLKVAEGVLTLYGAIWADISVSEALKERSLLLVDRFANELEQVGGHFENSHPALPTASTLSRQNSNRNSNDVRNCFDLHIEKYVLRIRERVTQELIPATPKQTVGRAQPRYEYRPPEYRYIPCGKLSLSVVSVVSYYEYQKTEDTPASKIEDKLHNLINRLKEASLRKKLEKELCAERELERRKKSAAWAQRKAEKDVLLGKLALFEKMAQDLDRAESLRRLRDRISTHLLPWPAPAEIVDHLTLMANWLDPLVKQVWPEIDDGPDKNPYDY